MADETVLLFDVGLGNCPRGGDPIGEVLVDVHRGNRFGALDQNCDALDRPRSAPPRLVAPAEQGPSLEEGVLVCGLS